MSEKNLPEKLHDELRLPLGQSDKGFYVTDRGERVDVIMGGRGNIIVRDTDNNQVYKGKDVDAAVRATAIALGRVPSEPTASPSRVDPRIPYTPPCTDGSWQSCADITDPNSSYYIPYDYGDSTTDAEADRQRKIEQHKRIRAKLERERKDWRPTVFAIFFALLAFGIFELISSFGHNIGWW